MKRVSSRQRLVSWDAFDATAASDDDESDFQTCYGGSSASLIMLDDTSSHDEENLPVVGRKRERPTSPKRHSGGILKASSYVDLTFPPPPTLIPAHDWELEVKPRLRLQLETLNQDVQLHIVAFLDATDARSFGVTQKYNRRLLLSAEARPVWRDWLSLQWPMIVPQLDNDTMDTTPTTTFVDAAHFPTAGRVWFADGVNLSALLGMASQCQPQCVDEALLVPPPLHRLRRPRPEPSKSVFCVKDATSTMAKTIQFTGKVGTGDRCIRSDQPLPRPAYNQALVDKASFLRKIMCRSSGGSVTSLPPWRPFVAPFVEESDAQTHKVNVTPRLVSYYEVSILGRPQAEEEEEEHDPDTPSTSPSDCVAVGLATRRFHMHGRMPGWDNLSYGYHGDDGGIFHGSGDMLRSFGPSFGPNDTVGCGVDYVLGAIFYTLNGKFLGNAWTHLSDEVLQQDFHATIGVDTNCPVQCNFGERPFLYDLSGKVERHERIVQECHLACRGSTAPRDAAGLALAKPLLTGRH